MKKDIYPGLIKKLRLRKGYKYLLIFPASAGLTAEDIARFPRRPELMDISVIVDDTRGIKVVEKEL